MSPCGIYTAHGVHKIFAASHLCRRTLRPPRAVWGAGPQHGVQGVTRESRRPPGGTPWLRTGQVSCSPTAIAWALAPLVRSRPPPGEQPECPPTAAMYTGLQQHLTACLTRSGPVSHGTVSVNRVGAPTGSGPKSCTHARLGDGFSPPPKLSLRSLLNRCLSALPWLCHPDSQQRA